MAEPFGPTGGSQRDPKDLPAPYGETALSTGGTRPHQREDFLLSLLFSEQNPKLLTHLIEACDRANLPPSSLAPGYTYLLNDSSPQIRVAVGEKLAYLNLPDVDLAPLLFSAYKRERNEVARNQLRLGLKNYSLNRISELENYYETSRFTVQAKRADLRNYTGSREISPQQFDRALILLHLDQSGDAKLAALSALCASMRYFSPSQRQALVLSIIYGLSDPEQANEFVISSLLYVGEWIGAEARPALPLIRRMYESDSPRVRSDSALVALSLGRDDPEAARIVLRTLHDHTSLYFEPEEMETGVKDPPPLDQGLSEVAHWVSTICRTEVDSPELAALLENIRDSYLGAYEKLTQVIDSRMAQLSKRIREASRKTDEVTRELYTLRVAGRIDRLSETVRRPVLKSLFEIVENPKEPLDARKALVSRLVLNREDTGYILSRLIYLLRDEDQSVEIRLTVCRSIQHLMNLKDEQVREAVTQLSTVANTATHPILRKEATLLREVLLR